MSKKGRFIVVEGLEGAGKSTIVEEIIRFLNDHGIPCLRTREPGGTPIAEKLREIIKSGLEGESLRPESELLLMYASRLQLLEEVIQPTLKMGTWVVSDRFELSTYAYQGGGRQLSIEMIDALSSFCLKGIKPDHTLFLEIMPESGLSRAKIRGEMDKIEQESRAFFSRVYHAYHERLAHTQHVSIIQASQPLPQVIEQVQQVLSTMITEHASL